MRMSAMLGAALSGLLIAATASAGDLESGPPVGKKIPGAFNPLHVNGPDADKKVCLV
jgi:hypothetical protein